MKGREALLLQYLHETNCLYKVGDDGVAINKNIYALDSFMENTHFKHGWLKLKDLAFKALSVNVSDIYAMGATPKYALLALSIPQNFSAKNIKELAIGIADACNFYKIKLIGGDTISSSLLGFHFTLIAEQNNILVQRKGLNIGDILCFSGTLGSSYSTLQQCLHGFMPTYCKRHEVFFARRIGSMLIPHISKHITMGMDISDGLSVELTRLSKINHVGFKFLRKLSKQELISGEEYQALIAVAPKNLKKVLLIAQKNRQQLHPFAQVIHGRYKGIGKEWHK